MKRKNAFIALLVLSLFLYEAVYGQGEGEQILRPNTQTGDSLEIKDKIRNLEEIVVTGTRTEKTLANTPILTRVISSAQLRQNDFENIMDALEYTIPGLQFNSDPRGDNIRIQGLENKYLLILVDGERLSTTPGGPIDFERLSLSNVKQIEIIKGAASALYGSSAIGMTINIITKTPDRKLEGWAKTRYSRFNDWVLDASVGTAFRKITSQTLFYRNSHNGYDLTPESPQAFTKDPGTNMNIEQKFAWNHKKTQITASGIYYLTEVTNPGESVKNTHYKSNNKTLRVTATQHFADNHQLKASYYGDFYTRNTIYQSTNESEKNATSDIQTLRILDMYTPSVSLQAIAGAEYNWNKDYNAIQYGEEKGTVVTVDQEEYSENLNWDMGFLRFNIRTNGGTSGKGQGAVYATDKKSFDEVTTIPTSGLITDSEISVMKSGDMPPKYAKTTGNTAFKVGENQGWAFYNYKTGDWTINNNVFIVRSANGKYAKVIMKNFLNEKDESGYITFEYVYPFN